MKFKLKTLGCRTNQYETQALRRQLEILGWKEAENGEIADLCVVNTCTVTESADQRSRYQVRHLHQENPGAEIIVTGCSAERSPQEFAALPGVSRVISNVDKETLVQDLFPDLEVPPFLIDYFKGHTRAFLKVQDGCNSYCSYCVIPFVRGRSRSKPLETVIDEAKALIDKGYKEIVLTGINIGDYDGDGKDVSLARLIREIDALPGLERLRVSSIDPDEVDEELCEAIMHGKHTCPSMHIVLQSGSNVVLKRMRRKYNRQMFFSTVDTLKKYNPDFTVTTDIIVGFPGETESDFAETLDVVKEVEFAKVHVFPYSDRPKTRASRFTDKVSPSAIKERKAKLIAASEAQSFRLREKYVGRVLTVLTEAPDEEGTSAHTANFLPVRVRAVKAPRANQLITVNLIENTPEGLIGIPYEN